MINDLDIVQWEYLLSPEFELINSAGKPLTGGWIEVYLHGTRDKYYCASDFNGTLHPFKIPLDSIGANVVLADPNNAYDVYVYNKFGSLIMSRYNVKCQGGGSGSSTYVGDKLYYGQYRASNVTTIANLRRNKGNINITDDGYLKLKSGMSYHITVRGSFTVDDPANEDTTLNYIEYTSVNPIKIDIDETKEGPQYFELSYDIYRLQEDMDYQVAFAQSNGMVTDLIVEVHSLSNLATSAAGGDQEYEAGWGIDITNNVVSVDPSIFEDYTYTAGDYISIDDNNVISVTGINPGDFATHDEVYEATVTAIELVTGLIPESQVQSDWNETDTEDPAYIQNKPTETELVAGQNIGLFAEGTTLTICASATDLSDYATHDEVNNVSGKIIETVNNVSGVLHEEIIETAQVVTGLIPTDYTTHEEVNEAIVTAIDLVTGMIPDAQVQSDWEQSDNTQVDYIKNKPDLDIYVTHEELIESVSAVTGIGDYGQFYATDISGAATMARTKGTISVTDDGKIMLKKGSSYHVTMRGRYNQTTASNTLSTLSLIEYITNNSISVNVDTTITDSQYFEISYDLYKLNSDTNYYVFFNVPAGKINDLFVEIHAIGSVGAGVSGGAGTEYDAGWGIQILNNVISVDPSILNDYTTNGDVYNSTVSAINLVTGMIPEAQVQSDWTEDDSADPAYIKNKPTIPSIEGLATVEQVSAVSGYLQNEIDNIPGQVQSDWTQNDNTQVDYIKNKPEEYDLVAGENIAINVSGSDIIISSTASGSTYTAGDNIDIDNDVISVKDVIMIHARPNSASGTSAFGNVTHWGNQDYGPGWWISAHTDNNKDYVSYNTSDLGQEEFFWGEYATDRENTGVSAVSYLSIHEGDISYKAGEFQSVCTLPIVWSCSQMAQDIEDLKNSSVSVTGLPTTELGKFTIQSNVSGGPIEVLVPTDVAPVSAFYDLNAQYDDTLSNRTGPSTYYYVFKSPGYDNDTWSAVSGDVIQLKVKETIQGIGAILGFYASNSSPASSSAPTINYPASTALVAGTGSAYTVEAGVYTTALGTNPAGSSYGKYITIMVNSGGTGIYVDDILNKIEFTIGRPNATLGTIVNLNRYYLANSVNSSTPSSQLACQVTVDSTTKQQKVYLPGYMPNDWISRIVQWFQYGTSYNSINGNSSMYGAYKYTDNGIQYAICTEKDTTNKLLTFLCYDATGNAIEKWTLDYTTYASNVWTTTPISTGSTYTAGEHISIENDEIAVTGITELVAGENITITTSGASAIISGQAGGSSYTAGTGIDITSDVISVDNTVAMKTDLPAPISGASGITVEDSVVSLDNPIGLVAGNNITIEVSGVSAIISSTGGGGGSSYTAGTGIDITNNEISVDNTVALKTDVTAAVSGKSDKFTVLTYDVSTWSDFQTALNGNSTVLAKWTIGNSTDYFVLSNIANNTATFTNLRKTNHSATYQSDITTAVTLNSNSSWDSLGEEYTAVSVKGGNGINQSYYNNELTLSINATEIATAVSGLLPGGVTPVQSNWNETDTSSLAYIQNKPTIPAAPVQSNWNETNTSSLAYIQNKPTIPAAQVQADWNVTNSSSMAYIKNKPTIPSISGCALKSDLTWTGWDWYNNGVNYITNNNVGKAGFKFYPGNLFTSSTLNNWTYSESPIYTGDTAGAVFIRFSALMNNVVGTQWSTHNNVIQLNKGHIMEYVYEVCGDGWNPTCVILYSDGSWTQSVKGILRDVRNSSTADNNTYYIHFSAWVGV